MSKKVKRYLMLLTAIGVLAVVVGGGSGTFAGFNAEVANTGNYFATGTMFLHATKQGGTGTCKSEVDSGNSNILSTNGCDLLFNLSNVAAGQTATVNLELDNAGSINASKLKFALGSSGCANGKATITTTTGTVSSGPVTTIAVNSLPYGLIAGTSVTITDGTHSDTLTLAANAASGANSITVTGTAANTYSSGAKIEYSATFGSSNLCQSLPIYIQEMGPSWSGNQQCVFGGGAGTSCVFGSTHVSDISTYNTFTDLTGSLWSGGSNTTALDAGGSRWFQIAVQAPSALTNANQNQSATFDLIWHIEQ